MSGLSLTLEALLRREFDALVDRAEADSCWIFRGRRDAGGYGRLRLGGRQIGAHIIAYLLSGRELSPERPCVLHTCDNPPCCNPEHLWAGTQLENIADMKAKGRANAPRGTEHYNAKLSADDVQEIRRLGDRVSRGLLAKRFGVTRASIRFILRGKTWRSLPPPGPAEHLARGSHGGLS